MARIMKMFGTKSSKLICFVHRNRLQFYMTGATAIATLEVPADVMRSLEVVNKDQLYVLVNQWIRQNAQSMDTIVIILSGQTYFDSQINSPDENEQETEILKFYDIVPFDELVTKVLVTPNGKHAFAVNKGYLESLQHAFILQGFRCVGVIPAYVLGPHGTKTQLDLAMGEYVEKHIDSLLPYSIVENNEPSGSGSPSTTEVVSSRPRSHIGLLLSIFGLLIIVFVILLLVRR